MAKKKASGSGKKTKTVKKTVRCRNCFMVDSYTVEETECKHCGMKIFVIDVL